MHRPSWLALIPAFLSLSLCPDASAQWAQQEFPMGSGKAVYHFDPTLPGPAVRVSLGSGAGDHGLLTSLALEASHWTQADFAVTGRLATSTDADDEGGELRTTIQMGGLQRLRERGTRSLVAGGGLGFDVRMRELGEGVPDAKRPPQARVSPPGGGPDGRDPSGCYDGSCPSVRFDGSLRTNLAGTVGWIWRPEGGREVSLLARGEVLGVSGATLSLSLGVGRVTAAP